MLLLVLLLLLALVLLLGRLAGTGEDGAAGAQAAEPDRTAPVRPGTQTPVP